ncbi:hypothetical protein C1646_766894 [Rhizophagus diaphanus]|nr:hypothetical protein C1646_766894 [Rhizophagus diaphanus] [Rhizophagus sp. MUCL 43196]
MSVSDTAANPTVRSDQSGPIDHSNYDILREEMSQSEGDDIVADKEFTEHGKCEQCRKDIFTINFEAFTVLPCAHVFHRECVEKSFLLNRQNNCPVADCTATVKPVVSDQSYSISSQSKMPEQEMVADEIEVMPEESTVHPDK